MENLESTQYQDQAGMVKSRYQTNTGTSSLSSNIYLNMWAQTVNQQATFYLKQVTSLRLTDHIASCGNWHQHFLLPLSNLWPTVFPSLNGSLYLKAGAPPAHVPTHRQELNKFLRMQVVRWFISYGGKQFYVIIMFLCYFCIASFFDNS